ncbi:DNA-directed RNA polymerase subunit delta [Macrococcus armenti]|uniref:DNA-directed RNA polymerase subunit delta n=1 Tax=Macrococcus armenti TaxID=2875764 RepID=UPI001CCF22EC|nr:DNA-directed RNA polymerase subunit delta [Macrococcus armenti]UBH15184.1 DNA-directed RNA polymerase subunit delta [Macrococcus armenti]UBH17544.1 DNA-directed RNA polymerase subunit delta [Macrococcus armenti]UBH19810.1 DNA-directed RNA polymerase subunit delta [Macrococcus armenti]
MKISEFTKEMMDENSFIDLAYMALSEKGKEVNLYDLIDEFKTIGGYSDEDVETRVVQFYTDLNTDGRFLSTGEYMWGLRDWYSVDDIEEKIAPTVQKFDILDEEDEDSPKIALLGEDEVEDELDLMASEEDEENVDSEDEEVEDELEEAGLVVEADEEFENEDNEYEDNEEEV